MRTSYTNYFQFEQVVGVFIELDDFLWREELSGKLLKHGTRRRVRQRRQFHRKFETLDFEKDKFTVKFANNGTL